MKARQPIRILLAVVLVFLVSALLVLLLGASGREPSREGRRLTEWLADLDAPGLPVERQEKADAVVREIGTNAVPTLLRMMTVTTIRPRFLERVQLWLVTKVPGYRVTREEPSPRRAMLGFWALGSDGKPAVSNLVALLKHPNRFVRQYSAAALGGIGPEAKDAIGALLHNLDGFPRVSAWLLLTNCRSSHSAVVLGG